MVFPEHGSSRTEVLAALEAKRETDGDWQSGRLFGYVYNAGDEITDLLQEVHRRFGMTNALNPMAFPSLRECEAEVLAMTADLLHGVEARGAITTGGTESICMALKTARNWARAERGETAPEVVLPATVHPAFHKAAHYFDFKVVTVPVREDFRVDPEEVRAALTDHTVLVVGSAPNFPYGVVDPITALGALARERGLLLHVDACLGGFMLPFLERLGEPIPPFDFRVDGVTSISADLHKFGYTAKGASAVLYRSAELRRHQYFVHTDWPGGLYGSPSMTGARGGGPIAAAWAVLKLLGAEGYKRLAQDALDATRALQQAIDDLPELAVMGEPVMSVFAFCSPGEQVDVYAVSELMEERGWVLDRLQRPPALHLTVSPIHKQIVRSLIADLGECTRRVAEEGITARGTAAMYGMLGSLPDRGQVADMILGYLDTLY